MMFMKPLLCIWHKFQGVEGTNRYLFSINREFWYFQVLQVLDWHGGAITLFWTITRTRSVTAKSSTSSSSTAWPAPTSTPSWPARPPTTTSPCPYPPPSNSICIVSKEEFFRPSRLEKCVYCFWILQSENSESRVHQFSARNPWILRRKLRNLWPRDHFFCK